MEDYQVELQQIYKEIHKSELINSLIALGVFIGIICIVRRIYKAYHQYQGEKDYKVLWDIAKQYVLMTLFICIFPFFLTQLELVLAGVQNDVSIHFNASVEKTAKGYIEGEIKTYVKETSEKSIPQTAVSLINPVTYVRAVAGAIGAPLNVLLMQVNKYLYFFFCAGRYLWLLMLEIVAPIAIFCILDENTKQYFQAWLKNMFICYLLVPFFLLADVLGERVIALLARDNLLFSFSEYSTLALIGMLVLKISLYKVAANRAFKLIE